MTTYLVPCAGYTLRVPACSPSDATFRAVAQGHSLIDAPVPAPPPTDAQRRAHAVGVSMAQGAAIVVGLLCALAVLSAFFR